MLTQQLNLWWQAVIAHTYARYIVIGVIAVLVSGLGFYGYRYTASSGEQRAHQLFAESYDLYEQALGQEYSKEKKRDKALWQEVELAFKTAYSQYPNSYLAPFFLGFQAEALMYQGALSEAIKILDLMLALLKSNSPFYGVYAIKRALMKFDMPDEQMKISGLQELTKVAQDTNSLAQDEALYYVGEYYWSHGDIAQAQDAWRRLRAMSKQGKNHVPSPWFALVGNRLNETAA